MRHRLSISRPNVAKPCQASTLVGFTVWQPVWFSVGPPLVPPAAAPPPLLPPPPPPLRSASTLSMRIPPGLVRIAGPRNAKMIAAPGPSAGRAQLRRRDDVRSKTAHVSLKSAYDAPRRATTAPRAPSIQTICLKRFYGGRRNNRLQYGPRHAQDGSPRRRPTSARRGPKMASRLIVDDVCTT